MHTRHNLPIEPPCTQEELREILDYDPATGHLIWKKNRNKSLIGKRAGTIRKSWSENKKTKYKSIRYSRTITVFGKMYREHHVTWLWLHNEWSRRDHFPHGLEIDHKNRDATDNRAENLHVVTKSHNNANTKRRYNSTNIYRGVFKERNGKYRAIAVGEKVRYYLGTFECPHEAAKVYNAKVTELWGEFAVLNEVPDQPTA
jgi:hypothetical protein